MIMMVLIDVDDAGDDAVDNVTSGDC